MPNKLDALKDFVAANPSARWWVEELTIRGRPDDAQGGIVSGGHVVLGLETETAGERTRQTFQPQPVSDAPNDVPLTKLVGEVALSQQATIEQQTATIAENEKAATKKLADSLDAAGKTLQETKEAHAQALADKEAAHASALQAKDDAAQATAEAHAAALKAKDEAHATALTAAKAESDQQIAELRVKVEERDATITDKNAMIGKLESVLGGTEASQELIKQRRLEQIATDKAAAAKRQADLEAEEAVLKGVVAEEAVDAAPADRE